MKNKDHTIGRYLKMIRDDIQIQNLISNSEILEKDTVTTSTRKAKKAAYKGGHIRDSFWNGVDGVRLRIILESEYGVDVGSTAVISKIKDALLLYIVEQLKEGDLFEGR